jgi:hypothetical protein
MGPEAYHTCADLERGLKVESTTLLFCTAYDPVWVILDPKPSKRTAWATTGRRVHAAEHSIAVERRMLNHKWATAGNARRLL